MKQENINYIAVGSFVLLMLLLLIYSLYRITGQTANKDIYYVQYSNVTGITSGSTVTYSGYPVGTVLEISPQREDGQTRYQLSLGIQSDWAIPDNSVARIVMPGILTEKQIDISEGDSKNMLQPGETLRSQSSVDLMALMNVMAGEFEDISDESLKPLIDNINNHITTLGTEFSNNIPQMTHDARNMINNLNHTSEQLRELLNEKNQKRLSSLFTNADEMSKSLNSLTGSLDKAGGQIDKLLSRSNRMLEENNQDIRHAILDLRRSLDVVSQSIDSIVHNVAITSRNMNELSRELRANPGLLLNGKPPQDNAKE